MILKDPPVQSEARKHSSKNSLFFKNIPNRSMYHEIHEHSSLRAYLSLSIKCAKKMLNYNVIYPPSFVFK